MGICCAAKSVGGREQRADRRNQSADRQSVFTWQDGGMGREMMHSVIPPARADGGMEKEEERRATRC